MTYLSLSTDRADSPPPQLRRADVESCESQDDPRRPSLEALIYPINDGEFSPQSEARARYFGGPTRTGRTRAALLFSSVAFLALGTVFLSREEGSGRAFGDGSVDAVALSETEFSKVEGFNCWPKHGAELISGHKDEIGVLSLSECKEKCASTDDCEGFIVVSKRDLGDCWLRTKIDLTKCMKHSLWDLYVKPGVGGSDIIPPWDRPEAPPQLPAQPLLVIADFFHLEGYNCWTDSDPAPGHGDEIVTESVDVCKAECSKVAECQGFIIGRLKKKGKCWLRSGVNLAGCIPNVGRQTQDWDFYLRKKSGNPALIQPSNAPLQEFYMYRATAAGTFWKFPLGEVNTGNLDGVLWYLMNEIVTDYSNGVQCPRRFGIAELHRIKVKMRPTLPLMNEKMNFGVRFAYDQGKCEGRCFAANKCSGEGDCAEHYNNYGYIIGCNRFASHWPFPDDQTRAPTTAPNGVWYSLPIDGRCPKGKDPDGTRDCTWNYEEAGFLTLEDIEAIAQGGQNCCNNKCTDLWRDVRSAGAMSWRVGAVLDLFGQRFSQWPRDLQAPVCDFDPSKWYAQDNWPKRDPWR